jgi:hypothetical protein
MKATLKSILLISTIFFTTTVSAQNTQYLGETADYRAYALCQYGKQKNIWGHNSGTDCYLDEGGSRLVFIIFKGINRAAGENSERGWRLNCRNKTIQFSSNGPFEKPIHATEHLVMREGCRL